MLHGVRMTAGPSRPTPRDDTRVEVPLPETDGPESDAAIDVQASHFRRARRARSTEVAEDYVELIADLLDASGEARAVDIARRIGVSHPTVVKTIGRLKREGLVISRPYRGIFLTELGREMAERSRSRHHIVVAFLLAVGVDEATAHSDAEGIEHHCSAATLAAFARWVDRAG